MKIATDSKTLNYTKTPLHVEYDPRDCSADEPWVIELFGDEKFTLKKNHEIAHVTESIISFVGELSDDVFSCVKLDCQIDGKEFSMLFNIPYPLGEHDTENGACVIDDGEMYGYSNFLLEQRIAYSCWGEMMHLLVERNQKPV